MVTTEVYPHHGKSAFQLSSVWRMKKDSLLVEGGATTHRRVNNGKIIATWRPKCGKALTLAVWNNI